jgi:hypothetical protein
MVVEIRHGSLVRERGRTEDEQPNVIGAYPSTFCNVYNHNTKNNATFTMGLACNDFNLIFVPLTLGKF